VSIKPGEIGKVVRRWFQTLIRSLQAVWCCPDRNTCPFVCGGFKPGGTTRHRMQSEVLTALFTDTGTSNFALLIIAALLYHYYALSFAW